MSTSARRRLMRDFKVNRLVSHESLSFTLSLISLLIRQRMQSDPPAGVSASPVSENVMTWYHFSPHAFPVPFLSRLIFRNAVIIGPADTPFEDGTFKLVMHFDENYPNKPPQVKFISRMVLRYPLSSKRVHTDESSILTYMHLETSVLISFRIVGHLLMMSPLSSLGSFSLSLSLSNM